MSEVRTQLVGRKLDLYAALRQLEQDHQDGIVDDAAYGTARRRYETEAAEILERIDALPEDAGSEETGGSRGPMWPRYLRRSWLMAGGAAALVVTAIVLFLVSAAHPRSANQTITGDQPAAASPPQSPATQRAIANAQKAVARHPRSVDALLALGSAYLDASDVEAADGSYLRAMKLDPARPEPRTLHATALGLEGRNAQALALLAQVERDYPGYGRAWLADGLFSSGSRQYARAVTAWQHFLALDPQGSLSPQVRRWIAAAKKAQRR